MRVWIPGVCSPPSRGRARRPPAPPAGTATAAPARRCCDRTRSALRTALRQTIKLYLVLRFVLFNDTQTFHILVLGLLGACMKVCNKIYYARNYTHHIKIIFNINSI